jgi:hypothetical protein
MHYDYMVAQLSDPAEYADTGDANRGSLDEKGMAFRISKIETHQRIRTFILRDAWLIDNDREDDEEESVRVEQTPTKTHPTPLRWPSKPAGLRSPAARITATAVAVAPLRQAAHKNSLQPLVVSDTVERW